MPPILNAQSISKRFGAAPLFENIGFAVHDADRIGLIGPNGAGKSTLLAILGGEQEPDSGEVAFRKRVRVSYVHQISEFAAGTTVRAMIESGSFARNSAGKRTRATPPRKPRPRRLRRAWRLRHFLHSRGRHSQRRLAQAPRHHRSYSSPVPTCCSSTSPPITSTSKASSGSKACSSPPTFAYVVVSHDRRFLENSASQIVELNRIYSDGMLRVKGSYSQFLEAREAWLEQEQRAQESLRNRVRTEIEWLRRGPKARATKAKARIDNANALIAQLQDSESRSSSLTAGIAFDATQRQTKRLIEMENAAVTLGNREILRGVTFSLTAGAKARPRRP